MDVTSPVRPPPDGVSSFGVAIRCHSAVHPGAPKDLLENLITKSSVFSRSNEKRAHYCIVRYLFKRIAARHIAFRIHPYDCMIIGYKCICLMRVTFIATLPNFPLFPSQSVALRIKFLH